MNTITPRCAVSRQKEVPLPMCLLRKTCVLLVVISALNLLASLPMQAQIINGTFLGTVTENTLEVSGIYLGDPIAGTYSYDASLVVQDEFDRPANPLTAFALTIGKFPHPFTLSELGPELFNQERLIQDCTPSADCLQFFFDFDSISGDLGQTITLQSIGYAPPQSYSAVSRDGALSFDFTATSDAAFVPEPGSVALLAGLGLTGGLFAVRYLHRRK